MCPKQGDIYERHVGDEHHYRIERRLVVDATESCILYQLLYEPSEGTCVGELTPVAEQMTMKEWKTWAKTAHKIEDWPWAY